MRFHLTRHPSSPAGPAIGVVASAQVLAPGVVRFRYRVSGDIRGIRVPAPAPEPGQARRADELWRHTCFEAFVRPGGTEPPQCYVELNFAPSGDWAAYAFASYRRALESLPELAPPDVRCRIGDTALRLDATLQMAALGVDSAVGLTAVIEHVDGRQSFWALAHPRATPDFHDAAGWTASLTSTSTASRT